MPRSYAPALALLAIAAAACSDVAAPGDQAAPPPVAAAPVAAVEEVMPGEVLVKFKDGADATVIANRYGLRMSRVGYRAAFEVMLVAEGSERSAAAQLAADPRVEWAEPNYLRQVEAINPNLWAFFNPGGLNMKYSTGKNSGQPLGASYASTLDSDMDNIEGYAAGGSPVIIGSIDTGVNLTHPEFTGRLIAGRDWYNNDNDPSDDDGHGSHTTGTMAGLTVGVAGVSGAASNVKVYVQKVCGRRGCPVSATASAIRAAADQGAVAVNVSIGGSSLSSAESDAIAYAKSKNTLVIASSGNSGTSTVSCPACDPNAISVGALNWRDARASYSQYGSGLDISAPGGECYSNTTQEGCIYSAYLNGGYTWMQGTSMAAPQVTGVAGIVASKLGLRGQALRDRLINTADDLGASGYDTTFGAGRVNAYRAITGNTLGAGL